MSTLSPPPPSAPPADPAAALRRAVRKDVPAEAPVTPDSIVLLRVGQRCSHECPMCTTMSGPRAPSHPLPELLRRIDGLLARGARCVALTGGEPPLHPEFWEIVAALRARGMGWVLHTNGRSFRQPGLAERAAEQGVLRALVSFHAHQAAAADAIAGARRRTLEQTTEGIRRLRAAGVPVMLNCVPTTLTLGTLEAHLAYCVAHFGAGAPPPDGRPGGLPAAGFAVKYAFPNLESRGREWAPVRLRYADVREELRRVLAQAEAQGVEVHFESVPLCVLGRPDVLSTGRTAYGETHYLDDPTGTTLHSVPWLEAEATLYRVDCQRCAAFDRCPGVSVRYAERFGLDELLPFPRPDQPWWA